MGSLPTSSMIVSMRYALFAFVLVAAFDATAVSLNQDGLGQGLIYPYYTVRSTEGTNAFNTYLSVVNHTSDAKAVRVRILASVVGRDGLTEPDHQYLEFADRFERDLVRLARLSDAQIAHYLQGGSEPHA